MNLNNGESETNYVLEQHLFLILGKKLTNFSKLVKPRFKKKLIIKIHTVIRSHVKMVKLVSRIAQIKDILA